MLDKKGFDLWADGYDKSVELSEESDIYPFAGYRQVLNSIYNKIKNVPMGRVLDIGLGTGVLAKKLYDEGYTLFGIDFSHRMLEIAQEKMPNATLVQHDFTLGLPPSMEKCKFDFVICTYAIHHLSNPEKVTFLKQLLECLSMGGKILLGDVAFTTQEQLEQCKQENLSRWDEDEIYPVWEELQKEFPQIVFEKISFCSGIFSLNK